MSHASAVSAMRVQGMFLESLLAHDVDKTRRRGMTASLDRVVIQMARRLAPELVLEIGAHDAWFSARMRRILPDARVIAFEANPEVHAQGADRLRGLGVDFRNQAVSDAAGQVTLMVPHGERSGPRREMGSLLRRKSETGEQTFEVDAVRLDDAPGVDAASNIMWIDVEGAVGMVLDGAPETLAKSELIYVELEPREDWPGQRIDVDIVDALGRYGLVPVLRDVQRRGGQYNALFLRETRIGEPFVERSIRRFVAELTAPRTAQDAQADSSPPDAAAD
ncbi:MAG TPA: FkbM family methyltransferase [Sphingomonas sp.]|jgi:FkbM family methyltransferase